MNKKLSNEPPKNLNKNSDSSLGGNLGKTVGGTTDLEEGMVSRTSTFRKTDYVRGIQLPDSDYLCFEGFNPLYGIWFSGSQYGTSISRFVRLQRLFD